MINRETRPFTCHYTIWEPFCYVPGSLATIGMSYYNHPCIRRCTPGGPREILVTK